MTSPNELEQRAAELEATNAALRTSLARLEILHATGQSIASQLDLEKLLQTVTDAATSLTSARFGAFFYNRVNESGEDYLLFTLSGAPREAFEKFGSPRATAVFAPTFRGEGPVRSDDISKDPRYGSMGPHHGMPPGHLPVCSYLAVAVKSKSGEVFGGLFFGHPEPGRFSEHSEQLIEGVAAQAAVAIENARLYQAAQAQLENRTRAEESLRDTDRRKDEFLATLAHELRNPLAPIRQAAMISQTPGATEAQKSWSHDVITRQVRNMSLLLDDLLDISRITRGTLDLRIEPTNLASVVESAIETARPAIEAKRHTLTVELPHVPVPLEVDTLRLSQVLSNLLMNAAKYTDPDGHVRITGAVIGGELQLHVIDDGVGIESANLPHIFDMFAQIRTGRDRSDGGLGIGLALSRGLVGLHGGRLEAQSAGLGAGSTFTIYLPLAARAIPVVPPVVQPAQRVASRRVLVADDNIDAGESLAMLLRLDGHEVEIATNGSDAVSMFASSRPEVAILDIGMPGLSGYEVAQRVRELSAGHDVMLIAVTGWGQESDKARAREAGFDYHFTKPVEPEALTALLSRMGTGTIS
jgi:signal transduction histidine kinase/CheY-like chemotaxis protein